MMTLFFQLSCLLIFQVQIFINMNLACVSKLELRKWISFENQVLYLNKFNVLRILRGKKKHPKIKLQLLRKHEYGHLGRC